MTRATKEKALAANLTFGVEIECFIPGSWLRDNGVAIGHYHAGTQIPGLPDGWNSQRDGSLSHADPALAAIEVVSPVLKGLDGLEQLRLVTAWLANAKAQVNASCGLHVHVGAGHLDKKGLARLVTLVARYEHALFASTGTHRREQGHYCESIKTTAYKQFAHDQRRFIPQARYHVLNLQNLAYGNQSLPRGQKATVEFRCFAGTINLTKIILAVQLAVGLVVKATNCPKQGWDMRQPKPTSVNAQGGTGEQAVRMLTRSCLAWYTKAQRDQYLVDASWLPAMRAELLRLVRKYDATTLAAQQPSTLQAAMATSADATADANI